MDFLGMYFGDVGVSQVVKSTAFTDDDDEKHIVYHAIISKKPLCVCVHMFTEHDNGGIAVCLDIVTWASIKHWYFDCLDNGECYEEVYREDLLHLFKGL